MDPEANLAAELIRLSSRDEYFQAASELLLRMFECVGASRVAYDAVSGEAEIINDPYIKSLPSEIFMDHPLVVSYLAAPAAFGGIRRLSDVATDFALHRTRTYQEAYRPLGIDRQITILTSSPSPQSFRAWSVVRGGADFRDSALELARPIQTMLRLLDTAYSEAPPEHSLGDAYSLTVREQEILQLLGRGLTGVAIGHLLGVSPRTVAKHLEHAYAKLGCTNRIDALRLLRGEPLKAPPRR